jgi:hypothetical protein
MIPMWTKLIPLVCAAWLVTSYVMASGQEKRFVEIPFLGTTDTFDLSTVQMIIPGRFTVISTTIDDPNVMKFELQVLDTLRTYCARPDGKYPAPAAILTLGPPDMPVESVEVTSGHDQTNPSKMVTWGYPYKRLTVGRTENPSFLPCKQYFEMRSVITNGLRTKTLYDCNRGLAGIFMNVNDDPSKALVGFVKKNTERELEYMQICYAVTHKEPYLPK